jgi:hypothetical protein
LVYCDTLKEADSFRYLWLKALKTLLQFAEYGTSNQELEKIIPVVHDSLKILMDHLKTEKVVWPDDGESEAAKARNDLWTKSVTSIKAYFPAFEQ